MIRLFTSILVILSLFTAMLSAQTISFQGTNAKTNAGVTIDSIRIYDITTNKDTTIRKTNTFDLNSLYADVDENEMISKFMVKVSPTMIDDKNTTIKLNVELGMPSPVNIYVSDSTGHIVSSYRNFLTEGLHEFTFRPVELSIGAYYIIVSDGRHSKTIKLINMASGHGSTGEITYWSGFTGNKSSKILIKAGDSYNFTGYANGYEPSHLDNQKADGGENFELIFTPKDNNKFNKNCIIPLLYKHIKDSDGSSFGSNQDCVFSFEPNDSLHFYIASDTDAVSVSGHYSINSGKVNLVITDQYFPINVTVTIDTSKDQITLPFNVISDKNGSSTWQKVRLEPEAYMLFLFNAITLDETGQTKKQTEKRVVDWGNSVKDNDPGTTIETITAEEPSVKVIYTDGGTVKLLFYTKNIQVKKQTFTVGPFASDPRTHLKVASPKNNQFDPVEKTALFISPWDGQAFPAWKGSGENMSVDYSDMSDTFSQYDSLDVLEKNMIKNGYKTIMLKDKNASVVKIIDAFLPGNGKASSPGMVYWSSHGDREGNVSTGTYWMIKSEREAIRKEIDAKYPDIWFYGGGTGDEYKTKVFSIQYWNMGWRPNKQVKNVFVTPLFWKWLKEKGADFSTSYVHLGACSVDANPEVRETIKAKVFLGYNITVPEDFCGATQRYFQELMSRPSVSAEEAYYNMLRLVTTGKMIYAEDKLLSGNMPTDTEDWYLAKAWGCDGTDIISYQEGGWWNSDNINGGNVWYLLWASRWSQDVQKGWQALLDCWDACWQYGDTGGLANPGCNNMAPGPVPSAQEVAYTGYLLKGEMTITPPGTILKMPRFTLNDSK